MGRATEILACMTEKTIPTNEQCFHIDVSDSEVREEIKKLRKKIKSIDYGQKL